MFASSLNTNAPSQGTSLFGNPGQNNAQNQQQPQQGGGLFGQGAQQPQQQTGGLFGNLGQNNQQAPQQGGGLFGNLGQNNQQNQQQQQQQQPQQTGGLFGQSTQQNQQQGGMFGQSQQQQQQQQQQQGGGLFGNMNQNATQQPQQGGMFGSFGQSTQQNQQQQGGLLSNSIMYTPEPPRQTSVQDQIKTIMEKWDPANPNCVFRHYFYNKVDESKAPYYRPGPNEDTRSWEEALSKKPGPGYIPVLCTGFTQMGERIKIQQRNLATFNQRLHDINNSLEAMLSNHDLKISVKALEAKRRHMMLKQRCLALATKVQILRNRGYAMGGDEEDLKIKLQALEKGICDPGLSARAEEIWARMVGVRERARILKEEMGKRATENGDGLDEETVRRAEKILEDYGKQLGHLKRELASVSEDLKEWEKDQAPQVNGR